MVRAINQTLQIRRMVRDSGDIDKGRRLLGNIRALLAVEGAKPASRAARAFVLPARIPSAYAQCFDFTALTGTISLRLQERDSPTFSDLLWSTSELAYE
jgi:hypothetical protein